VKEPLKEQLSGTFSNLVIFLFCASFVLWAAEWLLIIRSELLRNPAALLLFIVVVTVIAWEKAKSDKKNEDEKRARGEAYWEALKKKNPSDGE